MKLKIRFDNVNKKTWFSSIQFAKYHLQTTTGIFYKYFWFFFWPKLSNSTNVLFSGYLKVQVLNTFIYNYFV